MVKNLELDFFTEKVALPDRAIDIESIPWVPHSEGVWFKPLRFDLTTGNWVHLTKMSSGAMIRRHRHTGGPVFAYPLQGEWYYLERDWVAKPGTFVYEPPGDIHTLVVDKDKGEMITLFFLGGVIQYLDDNNNVTDQDDIFLRLKKYTDYCEANNIPIVNLKY
ncbi:cupin [Alkalihalophilus pseudofirmus]|nr:cupin [Alkalihalophilus pseudofirmus]